MKKIILISFLVVVLISLFSFKGKDGDPIRDNIRPNPYPLAVTSVKLDANTISTWFRTNGSFNYDPFNANNSGFEWPKGSLKFARFASGLWLGARVGNDTLAVVAEYSFEYLPGYTDNNGTAQGKDDPAYVIYKLIKGVNNADRTNWPNYRLGNSDQGAPVFFDSLTGTWKPLDLGTQTIWAAFTDSYPESHIQFNSLPLKADIKKTSFAFDLNGPLGQIAFTQWVIINRGTSTWNAAYLTVWTDDDLGSATDDKVAVDSAKGLGFTYNGAEIDPVYGIPPAVGFDFFRGAILRTNDPSDTAYICRGESINTPGTLRDTLIGYKQLGLTVFNWYCNTCPPPDRDPQTAEEAYNYMSGNRQDGSPMINPIGNYRTRMIYSGDPVTNTGWIQSQATDQRFMQSTGPFTMNPGDTQIIVVGQVIAQSTTNRLASITAMRDIDVLAQKIYDNCFNVPTCAPPPTTSSFAPGNGKIYLTWGDASERLVLPNKIRGSQYKFQGYNIYQVKAGTNGSQAADRKLLATYDLKDNIGDIKDTVVDEFGVTVFVVVQKGTNNGVSRHIKIDKDNILNQQFINGTPYYFSVTCYHYDSLAGPTFASQRVCESSIPGGFITVIPQRLTQGTQTFHDIGDTISTNRRDLAVMPLVIQPFSLISASYTSTFGTFNNTLVWTLTRSGTPQPLIENYPDFSASQDTAVLVDGFFPLHQVVNDSGVVKDKGDPRGVYSKSSGWSYSPPQNQWVQGVDTQKLKTIPTSAMFKDKQFDSRAMGISFPHGSNYRLLRTRVVAHEPYFRVGSGSNPNLAGGPLRKVRIVFGQQQLAYRYVPILPLPDTALTSTPYADYVNVPFQVFAVDLLDSSQGSPRQLNCAFVDADANGVWDPDASLMGKFQILYVFASSYEATPRTSYTARNIGSPGPFQQFDIMYVWVPRVISGGPQTYTNGDVLEIHPYIITRADFVPGYPTNYSWNIQGTIISSSSLASQNNQMDNVKVFPNPYYGQSRLETNPVDRFVYFSNLPKECTIYIYALNGVLVKKIIRNAADPRNSLEKWNLRNDSDIPVASGMYIALVDAPGIGTKILKLAVFTPEERIDTF